MSGLEQEQAGMTFRLRYTLPVEQTEWRVDGPAETVLDWNYDEPRGDLLALYDKGKRQQWDAAERIDWRQDLDPENPLLLPDQAVMLYGSPFWEKMSDAEKRTFRHHIQAWQISQFLHGEQGALICTSRIVQTVPDLDAKFYAATQVADEARHVEAFSRLLKDKFELAYPVNASLQTLLGQAISDRRWDFTYLGMQILVEGLALASFQRLRDLAGNRLIRQINAYVMQDEARHVAFGRSVLRDLYPRLTEAERAEREEFVIEASRLMYERLTGIEVLMRLGLPVKECVAFIQNAPAMQQFRSFLFSRIVPTVRYIGLWGPKVQEAYRAMGLLGFADVDADALMAEDDRLAMAFDA
jgi:hypothetical protein